MTIRIVLADDHPIVLDGLAQLLCVEGEFGVVARARNGEEALHAVHQYLPDILVLDLRMPVKGGLAVIREMKRDAVPTQVVLLTAANDDDVIDAIRLGVRGVILKDMAPKLLLECVRKVHAGGKWLAKEVTLHGMDVLVRRETIARAMTETLTPREMQVARMICRARLSHTGYPSVKARRSCICITSTKSCSSTAEWRWCVTCKARASSE